MLTHFHEITGVKLHMTIPYSKKENGIVERANKKVNRHMRNIMFDKDIIKISSKMMSVRQKNYSILLSNNPRRIPQHITVWKCVPWWYFLTLWYWPRHFQLPYTIYSRLYRYDSWPSIQAYQSCNAPSTRITYVPATHIIYQALSFDCQLHLLQTVGYSQTCIHRTYPYQHSTSPTYPISGLMDTSQQSQLEQVNILKLSSPSRTL